MNTVFKAMDDFINKQMDIIKESPFSNKVSQSLQQFNPESQKIINQCTNLTVFAIPIFFLIYITFVNLSLKNEVTTKQKILGLIHSYSQKTIEMKDQSRLVLSPKSIATKEDLENLLKQDYNLKNISEDKITIKSFTQNSRLKPLLESKIDLHFKNLTMQKMTSLFTALLKNFKMKVTTINIKLEEKGKTLSGDLSVTHYSRNKK